MTECRWAGSDHPRVLPERHVAECAGGCHGCQPCPERHCLRCGIEHHDHVCPGCLHSTRSDLDEIVRLYAELGEEAQARGIDSEAMNLLGPCADPEARGHLEASVAVGRVERDVAEEILPRDEHHPLWVLKSWAGIWRDALEHDPPTMRETVEDAAGYLGRNLADVSRNPHVEWAQFAGHVAACLDNLQRVLHDRERVAKGAPCATCDPPVALVQRDGWWKCGGCKRMLTEEQYREVVRAGYLAQAEVLHVDDLAERTGIPRGTIRYWAAPHRRVVGGVLTEIPPLIRAVRRTDNGRAMYRVADVIAIRDRDRGGDVRTRA